MILNNLNNSDLRSKLGKQRTKIQYRDPIQVVVTNTNLTKSSSLKRNNSSTLAWRQSHQITKEIQPSEREEGEWEESESKSDEEKEDDKIEQTQYRQYTLTEDDEEKKEEEEKKDEEEEKSDHREDEEDSADEDSDMFAKEIQGPKGSVIKVVPPKPRIASTVWARLNRVKSEVNDSYLKNR